MAVSMIASRCQGTVSLRTCAPQRRARCIHVVKASVTAERQSLDLAKMEPLADRVLVKPYIEAAKSVGGILLPTVVSKANSDAHFGTVVSVGADVKLTIKAGDVVAFQKYSIAEVEVPEGEVLFVAEKSILGLLE